MRWAKASASTYNSLHMVGGHHASLRLSTHWRWSLKPTYFLAAEHMQLQPDTQLL
jgi:hypothetical protein